MTAVVFLSPELPAVYWGLQKPWLEPVFFFSFSFSELNLTKTSVI